MRELPLKIRISGSGEIIIHCLCEKVLCILQLAIRLDGWAVPAGLLADQLLVLVRHAESCAAGICAADAARLESERLRPTPPVLGGSPR